MRVLVTGAAGFIGSAVADALLSAGHQPVLVDALLPQAHGAQRPESSRGHEFVTGDLADAALTAELVRGVDAVCHQAAMVGHGLDPSDAPDYTANNDHATAVLLAAMHRCRVSRLVLASSMVIYGEGRYRCADHGIVRPGPRRAEDIDAGRFEPPCPHCGRAPEPGLVGEDDRPDPRSTYAATKLAQEHLAGAWARQTGGSVWALRYHNVYGPQMPRDTPYSGVAALFRSALEAGKAPTVLEDGAQLRDFVHVSDVAAANLAALDAPSPGIHAANVCSGQPRTVGDLAATLAAATGGPEPEVVGGARPADVRHVVADPSRARELLGFAARVGFEDGIVAFATDPLRAPSAGAAARA